MMQVEEERIRIEKDKLLRQEAERLRLIEEERIRKEKLILEEKERKQRELPKVEYASSYKLDNQSNYNDVTE